MSSSGEPFPRFLLDHIKEQWHGVAISPIDPDICLKVDTALAYTGCTDPSLDIRQFLYVYHESADFDYEILPLLLRLFKLAGDDEVVWNNLLTLDLQRDCGLSREEYAGELLAMIEELEVLTVLEPDQPPAQLSA